MFAPSSRPFKALSSLAAGLMWCLAAAPLPAAAQPGIPSLDQRLSELGPDQLEELFVFVAGNALFTVYHEAGHMLISELGIPVLAQEEDAVDNLATISMLSAGNGDMDLLLINAMIGWFLIASNTDQDLTFYGEHDLDLQRGYRMLCLMVGADEDTFSDLARDLDLPDERIDTCSHDYEQAADSWEAATDPYLRASDTPAGRITVIHEPAETGLQAVALFLREAEILEMVAQELDTLYQLPEPVIFGAGMCGEANAFWDPGTGEVILCHELLGEFAEIYLAELMPI